MVGLAEASEPLTPFTVVARPPIELRGLTHKDRHIVGVGFGTNIVVSTNSGTDWFVYPITLPAYPGAMAVTAAAGQFVAVGWGGTIVTSLDGLEWTRRRGDSETATEEYWSVTYGGDGFVAVGFQPNASAIVATSYDGTVWHKRAIPVNTALRSVAYGRGVYVAVGTPTSLISSNGWDWTSLEKPLTANAITFGGGQFIATAQTNGFRSTNGTSWASFDLPVLSSDQNYYAVHYAGSMYVAAGFCEGCTEANRRALFAYSYSGDHWYYSGYWTTNMGPVRAITFANSSLFAGDSWQTIWSFGFRSSSVGYPKTITFDDLAAGPESLLIPSFYEDLQWYYLRAIDAYRPITSPGIRNGVVSPNNVAINSSDTSMIWAMTNFFDLHSAYLTSTSADPLQLRVQGFRGATVSDGGTTNSPRVTPRGIAYENTYTLNPNTPTFIEFNYLDVDQVMFFDAAGFVMDNVTVTLGGYPPWSYALDLGRLEVTSIGHSFVLDPRPIGDDIRRNQVRDFLVHQRQTVAGGSTLPSVNMQVTYRNHLVLSIAAPAGMKFVVRPPPGTSVRFEGFLWWQQGGQGGQGLARPAAVSFANLEGTAPSFEGSLAALSDAQTWFGVVNLQSSYFTNHLAFTSMTITGAVAASDLYIGGFRYNPHGNSYLGFSYTIPQTNDPGRFVSIVPEAPSPLVRLGGISANSTELWIEGRAGWTVVVEASANLVEWTPVSTNTMPFTLCPSCPFVIVNDPGRYSHRFYRAYERP